MVDIRERWLVTAYSVLLLLILLTSTNVAGLCHVSAHRSHVPPHLNVDLGSHEVFHLIRHLAVHFSAHRATHTWLVERKRLAGRGGRRCGVASTCPTFQKNGNEKETE